MCKSEYKKTGCAIFDAPAMPLPLSHIRVLDLTRLLPGPMATRHLAELGAEVTCIRAPEAPGSASEFAARLEAHLDRGKRILSIDLREPAGRDAFLRLAAQAAVMVEGFRPGVVDRLGIGYDAIRALNPRIVYCSISGYGQSGPDRLRAGHDINYMAAAGVAGDPPVLPQLQPGDLLGGSLTAVMRILAALVGGVGEYIDVSMTDSLLAHAVVPLVACGAQPLSGDLPCYNYYRAADGRFLAVGALERKFWDRLCDALGRPDLEPRHLDGAARADLQALFETRSSAEWLRLLDPADCCVNLVLTFDEALARRGSTVSPIQTGSLARKTAEANPRTS
jgi:crotonobetainyl-CoA:carnitine CoA-transferase CaiB-like acyl-CoA transferase